MSPRNLNQSKEQFKIRLLKADENDFIFAKENDVETNTSVLLN